VLTGVRPVSYRELAHKFRKEVMTMTILRSHVAAAVLALATLIGLTLSARAQSREGGRTDEAFPLWTQNAQGDLIVVDSLNGTIEPAPYQFRATLGPIYSFAYDERHEVLWGLSGTDTLITLSFLNPYTGESGPVYEYVEPVGTFLYSLTYRHSDGLLYAFQKPVSSAEFAFNVVSINPANGQMAVVSYLQPFSIEWHNQFVFYNDPPINLTFDPKTNLCYYETSLSGDGGVLLELDLHTGASSVVFGIGDSIALTFEPTTSKLFGLGVNLGASGNSGLLFETTLPNHQGKVEGRNIVSFPVRFPFGTSLAFVPHVVKE
jgi:hypothetical protein